MFSHASDEATGTLISVFSGADTSDPHYASSLHEMELADLAAATSGNTFTYIVVVDNDVPRPPAVWRKRFSDANYGVRSQRFYFAMVTTSMLMRGVYTAVNWVTAKREGQFYNVLASVADVQHWLQKQHGVSCPDLVQLEQRAREGLLSSPRVSALPR